MSRSHKKTKIYGVCGDTEKQDKRRANRKLRRKVREKIDDEVIPTLREISNRYSFEKDVKIYCRDKKTWEKLKRK